MKLLKITIFLFIFSAASFSQTTYLWTGSVNSSFSTAGNWSPIRQVGLTTDILVFENGSSLNVINVNQVTIGQLIIRNNTRLTLSPSSGNSKTISIKGAAGEDLLIESGSSLTISGNDPQLNIYIMSDATASISGMLSFQGSMQHNINSNGNNAIKFKNGSVLTQLCPGSIFTNTGLSNVVLFESGSSLKINNTNALSPFGIAAPNSKVTFEKGSVLEIIKTGSLSLNGRTISDLIIEQGNNINISEPITADVTIGNITIKNGAELNITNTHPQLIAKFNIRGSINVEGSFKFSSTASNPIEVNLNGTQPQTISGSGEILLPKVLKGVTISNDIILQKDLYVHCPLNYYSGEITYNGFRIFSSRKNITIDQQDGISNDKLSLESANNSIPLEYSISQNYPNPFNPSTKINYTLPKDSKVTIKVFDITGKEVSTLVDSDAAAGYHTVDFNATALSSGIYFYTISTNGYNKTLKMILAK
jgi:hypothetical protein